MLLVSGRISALVVMIALSATILALMWRAKKTGKGPQIRKIAGLEALEEGVGRAAETGRPALVTFGLGTVAKLYTSDGPQLLAGVSILHEVARMCAEKKVELVAAVGQSEMIPPTQEAIRLGYVKQGKPELYDSKKILYLPEQAYTIAISGLMRERNFAFCVYAGPFIHESIILGEMGYSIGAFQVGATAATPQIPFLVATCDFTLIGEELMAAGAYLGKDPGELGGFLGEDIGKIWALLISLAGIVTVSLGFNWIATLLRF